MREEIIGSVREAAAISCHVMGAGALGSSLGAAFSSYRSSRPAPAQKERALSAEMRLRSFKSAQIFSGSVTPVASTYSATRTLYSSAMPSLENTSWGTGMASPCSSFKR